MKKWILYAFTLTAVALGIAACKTHYFRSNYKDANQLLHETKALATKPFLKAHLKNGDVCILRDSWQVDTTLDILSGNGTRYDYNRTVQSNGAIRIPIDSVAIFETNTKLDNTETGRITALALMAGVDVALSIICITNPKACFGSCPTFYLNENDSFHYSDAEGFSNAIAPSMEYGDIDALQQHFVGDSAFSITMKNEALETHCVNEVKLLACPLEKGERVYQSPDDRFYRCQGNFPLAAATAPEGDITPLLQQPDRRERSSLANENNLSDKEEIYLNYSQAPQDGPLGLVLHFRQTLMTTYFIYSAMGYMGDEVGDIFAKIETGGNLREKLKNGIKKELGQIDIYAWDESKKDWVYQNGFYETGPIAINRQMIPLPNRPSGSDVKLKIVLNKGLWRIDYAGLTGIRDEVQPVAIAPSSISNKGKADPAALRQLQLPDAYLLSMPGSEYQFQFDLPKAHTEYELFLYSKGYYLEWMREHWIKDKNLLKLRQMVEQPKKYLREEAKTYKQYETTLEQAFWNSKIDTKTFSYYEN